MDVLLCFVLKPGGGLEDLKLGLGQVGEFELSDGGDVLAVGFSLAPDFTHPGNLAALRHGGDVGSEVDAGHAVNALGFEAAVVYPVLVAVFF